MRWSSSTWPHKFRSSSRTVVVRTRRTQPDQLQVVIRGDSKIRHLPHALLFARKNGKSWDSQSLGRRLRTALDACTDEQIPAAKRKLMTFHSLRHTTRSILRDLGFDAFAISAQVGHKTVEMAAHYHAHAAGRTRADGGGCGTGNGGATKQARRGFVVAPLCPRPVLLPRLHDVAVQRDVLDHGVAVFLGCVVATA